MKTRIAAIIPARMASQRFPGKPLLEIMGLPMIEHVRRRALLCPLFSDVVVATCDPEIAEMVDKFGGRVAMTADTHKVATERIIEAMQPLDCTHVMNVQGDEILILPSDLERMAKAIENEPQGDMWNAISPVAEEKELDDVSIVKCVVSLRDKLLFCSRRFDFLPLKKESFEPVCKVLGILAYSRSFLGQFQRLEQTPLELLESIEQSRILESGFPIQGVRCEKGYPGINTPEEAELVKQYLKTDRSQQEILEKIL